MECNCETVLWQCNKVKYVLSNSELCNVKKIKKYAIQRGKLNKLNTKLKKVEFQ